MASLQEQLLKAGMVDQKKAKEIQKQKRKQSKQKKLPKGQKALSETQQLAQKAIADKATRDRDLNKQRQELAQKKAIAAQIQQLIQSNQINRSEGDIAYQFTHNKKIKKLYVTAKLQNQLSRGFIAIVSFNQGYELVPAAVADKIKYRDESSVVIRNDIKGNETDEDDPYADYKIPDDLMW